MGPKNNAIELKDVCYKAGPSVALLSVLLTLVALLPCVAGRGISTAATTRRRV